VFECTQSVGELRPFPVEPGQPIFQSRNLSIDVVSAGDWSPLSAVGSSGWRILARSEPKGFIERGLANFVRQNAKPLFRLRGHEVYGHSVERLVGDVTPVDA